MEATVPVTGGLTPAECADLVELVRQDGPFVTCYLDTEPSAEDSPHRIEVRWKDAQRELVAQGADEEVLAAMEEALGGVRSLGEAVGLVAAGQGVLLREAGEEALGHEIAWR